MSDFLSRLNPLHKLIAILVFSTVLTFVHSIALNLWVFGICMLLLLVGTPFPVFKRVLALMLPIGIVAVSIFMTGLIFGSGDPGQFGSVRVASTQSGLNMATRVFPFAALSFLVAFTTDSRSLVKRMQLELSLPRKFAYGMLCAVHVLPLMQSEYRNSRLAFKVRGVALGWFSLKPVFAMLVNIFRWSETLSMAMFSRGFYEP